MYEDEALSQQMAAGQSAPMSENIILKALSHSPALAVSSAWNANRGSNTILKGGYAEGAARGPFRNTIFHRPRVFGRFSSTDNIHGTYTQASADRAWRRAGRLEKFGFKGRSEQYASKIRSGELGREYTPFNFVARTANWGVNKWGGDGTALGARLAENNIRTGDGAEVFQRGAYGKMTASSKLFGTHFRGDRGAKRFDHVMDYLQKNDKDIFNIINRPVQGSLFDDAPKFIGRNALMSGSDAGTRMGQVLAMSGKSAGTQFVGGYMTGARAPLDPIARSIAEQTGKEAFLTGTSRAAEHLALGGQEAGISPLRGIISGFRTARTAGAAGAEGVEWAGAKFLGAKAAGAVGMAIPGLNAVLAAKMAYDVISGGMELVKGAAHLAGDAVTSFKGTIDKPIMGMGYHDNEVAATSRARGVAAIQNSRLNARSVLGSEAGAMAARYG